MICKAMQVLILLETNSSFGPHYVKGGYNFGHKKY